MKRIVTIALSLAATLITSGSALAQAHAVKATVPFNFSLNGTWMPAGTYTIRTESNQGMVLRFASREQKSTALAMGQIDISDPGQNGKLLFHKYGERYFLSEVRYPHSSTKVYFPPTRAEKKVREGTNEASLPVNNNVLLALN